MSKLSFNDNLNLNYEAYKKQYEQINQEYKQQKQNSK